MAVCSVILGVVVVAAVMASAEPAPSRPTSVAVPDGPGDSVNADTGALTVSPRADIIEAGISYEPGAITFAMARKDPSSPLADLNWMSDFSYAQWWLDVTGDLVTDYVVQYSLDGPELSALVSGVGDADTAPPLCTSTRAANENGVDAFVIPADCLGSPQRIAFQLGVFYDTDVNRDDAAVVTDGAPDHGMAGPVWAPPSRAVAPAIVTPQSVPTAQSPLPPSSSSTTTSTARSTTTPSSSPVAAPAPRAPAPRAAAPAPSGHGPERSATTVKAPAAPAKAVTERDAAATPRPGSAAVAPPASSPSAVMPVATLPKTGGSASRTLIGLGFGVALIGFGVQLMANARRRSWAAGLIGPKFG